MQHRLLAAEELATENVKAASLATSCAVSGSGAVWCSDAF